MLTLIFKNLSKDKDYKMKEKVVNKKKMKFEIV